MTLAAFRAEAIAGFELDRLPELDDEEALERLKDALWGIKGLIAMSTASLIERAEQFDRLAAEAEEQFQRKRREMPLVAEQWRQEAQSYRNRAKQLREKAARDQAEKEPLAWLSTSAT